MALEVFQERRVDDEFRRSLPGWARHGKTPLCCALRIKCTDKDAITGTIFVVYGMDISLQTWKHIILHSFHAGDQLEEQSEAALRQGGVAALDLADVSLARPRLRNPGFRASQLRVWRLMYLGNFGIEERPERSILTSEGLINLNLNLNLQNPKTVPLPSSPKCPLNVAPQHVPTLCWSSTCCEM